VHALLEAATRHVIRQLTIEAVDDPQGLASIEDEIIKEVNTELESLKAEVALLVIQEISLPDDTTAAKQAEVVQGLRDEAKRQVEAARIQAVQRQLQMIEKDYGRAKSLTTQQRRQHQDVLLQSLQHLRRQPGAQDIWTASLDELVKDLEQVHFSRTP
jgi:DNA repair exonuclease SbcCD ATPase subunit